MNDQEKFEIEPIKFNEQDLKIEFFEELSLEEIQKIYMENLGIPQKDFEVLRNQKPKTSDQYK